MPEPLTPAEVDEYRKIPHSDFGIYRYSRLVATVDALAEVLRAVAPIGLFEGSFHCRGCHHAWRAEGPEPFHAKDCPVARVAAWLEKS